ncbi:MAG: HlyD family efflux transporter periplasmic adaptor subunit [Nitrospirales bacterium]|nr:HlyD family efflux transporter periplasmic adaptor subunit [Nitrospira sp.]MDR4503109.1 HlyD family efflux transporter periplasmic adaptor subunit [Nitrospirales bacterium]
MPTLQGEPTWTIVDPVRNAYLQIGYGAYQLLTRWNAGTVEQLVDRISLETSCTITKKDVEEFLKFLYANHLTQAPMTGSSATFAAQAEARQQSWLIALLHQYLFFKIPVIQPDRLLKITLPYVAPLMTPVTAAFVAVLGILGVFLVSRQWDGFIHSFLHLFSLEGVIAFGIALCGVKVLHECAHAFTATKYGCRVHTMGIAFLVMFPLLYTDTTDAWRLASRRERILIAASGMIAEVALAMCATFLWNFLPDGIFRSIVFVIATTSWVMSLTINLNPLLRFDGYYVLSDFLGIPNLQQRAFAFGRWKLRDVLFGLNVPPPEHTTPLLRKGLIAYAWSTWLFRFVLLTGIAVLVYHFFFKLLGVILFTVEIVWFIVMPVCREIKEWWKFRDHIVKTPRAWISGTILALIVLTACMPWHTRVTIPAILQAEDHTVIFSPAAAQLLESKIDNGQHVEQGEILIRLTSPSIEHDLRQAHVRVNALKRQIQTITSDPDLLANTHVLIETLGTELSTLRGLQEMKDNLLLKAPFSGVIVDVQQSLHPKRWINEQLPLTRIFRPQTQKLVALTSQTELSRLQIGQHATFIPDDLMQPAIQARISDIRHVDEETLVIPYLASVFGGNIPVRENGKGELIPKSGVYRVTLTPLEHLPPSKQVIKGLIHVQGAPQSLAIQFRDFVVSVLVREMGF